MDGAAEELREAVWAGNLERMRILLAAAPDSAALVAAADQISGSNALHHAFLEEQTNLEVVRLLVAVCPAAAAAHNGFGHTPFHLAAIDGHVEAARLLLKAMPAAALVTGASSWKGRLPLHVAAQQGHATMVQLLLGAAPSSAAAEDQHGCTPLDACCMPQWSCDRDSTARLLIAAPGQQPARLLQSLRKGLRTTCPLFADVASRYPLSPAGWHLVPSPCPGLAAALPTVLQRSTAEAALLVARLPEAERCGLRAAVLCLHGVQKRRQVWLPQPLVWRILAEAMA